MGHQKSGRCSNCFVKGKAWNLRNLSRWHYVGLMQVTFEEYPEVNYPTNCHGTFYLFSGQVRNKLLEVQKNWTASCTSLLQAFVARKEKIFKIDDVFVTGILAKEAGGIKHRLKCHNWSIFTNFILTKFLRPVNGMVGISVGRNNAYSMLTGPFRFTQITIVWSETHCHAFGYGKEKLHWFEEEEKVKRNCTHSKKEK